MVYSAREYILFTIFFGFISFLVLGYAALTLFSERGGLVSGWVIYSGVLSVVATILSFWRYKRSKASRGQHLGSEP